MRHLVVIVGNWMILVVVLIGIPSITSIQFGGLQIASTAKGQFLTLLGLGFGVGANLIARWLFRDPKIRQTCGKWIVVHAFFLTVQVLYFQGILQFDWLKKFLLWIQEWAAYVASLLRSQSRRRK